MYKAKEIKNKDFRKGGAQVIVHPVYCNMDNWFECNLVEIDLLFNPNEQKSADIGDYE